jgi:hypothetical protein
MILFLDSANHYTTAQIGSKYDTASNATVVPGQGRIGSAALFFDTALTAKVIKNLTPSAFGAGGNVFTHGFAFKPVTIPGTYTIAILAMSAGLNISLQVTGTGQLQIVRSDTGAIVAISPAQTLRAGIGQYLEWQWNSNNGSGAGSAIIRVNQSVVAQATFPTLANTYTSVQFGPSGAQAGTFYVCDVYVLDGNATLPVGGITRADGTVTTLSDFLGNMSVQALLPTADGLNLTTGNTPWTPALSQPTNYTQVNSRSPVDGSGAAFNLGPTAGMRDAYVFRHPMAGTTIPGGGPWGYFVDGTPWPLYGVQWVARARANAAGVNLARLVRKIVTGTFAGDSLSQGTNVAVTNGTTKAYLEALSADPTNANAPWNLANLSLLTDQSLPGNVELGVVKV